MSAKWPETAYDSSPVLPPSSQYLVFGGMVFIGLVQIPMMIWAILSGVGYAYVLAWALCCHLFFAFYFLCAGNKKIAYITRWPGLEILLFPIILYGFPYALSCAVFMMSDRLSDQLVNKEADFMSLLLDIPFISRQFGLGDMSSFDLVNIYLFTLVILLCCLTIVLQVTLFSVPVTRSLMATYKTSRTSFIPHPLLALILFAGMIFSVRGIIPPLYKQSDILRYVAASSLIPLLLLSFPAYLRFLYREKLRPT